MNIPQSAIKPFEPHGLPKLNFIKTLESTSLEIILDIMNALDACIKDNADTVLLGHDLLPKETVRALGEHMCAWLEKAAMDAGADTVHAKARAMLADFADGKEYTVFDTENRNSTQPQLKIVGFMYLVDFTVNDEEVNHLLDYKLKSHI